MTEPKGGGGYLRFYGNENKGHPAIYRGRSKGPFKLQKEMSMSFTLDLHVPKPQQSIFIQFFLYKTELPCIQKKQNIIYEFRRLDGIL